MGATPTAAGDEVTSKEIYMLIDNDGHFYLDETQCVWTDAWDATEDCALLNRYGCDYSVFRITSDSAVRMKTAAEDLQERFLLGELTK